MQQRPSRPYFTTWLRRTRKQLAVSGRLSEVALILSQREGRTPSDWSNELRSILENDAIPSLDLVTTIDTILAKPKNQPTESQSPLFF